MTYVFSTVLFGLLMVAIGRAVYWSFDHSGWSSNAKPDANATIVDMSSERVEYRKNGAKLKTTVSFSDGFYFITHATKRKDHFPTYTIYIDDLLKKQIIEKATNKHAAAARKKCGK